jgi:competence protein ComEC
MKLNYGETGFLFTGDLEGENLLNAANKAISAQVLKLPHHGSAYSFNEDFYRRVSPLAAVICVGQNSYGHPALTVVEYWERRNIPLFRTDIDGAVTFWSDGKNIRAGTFY